jgi:hypothetical protein
MLQDIIELKENNWVPRNARSKGQFCNTNTLQSMEEPMTRKCKPDQYKSLAPIVISTVKIHLFFHSIITIHLHYTVETIE